MTDNPSGQATAKLAFIGRYRVWLLAIFAAGVWARLAWFTLAHKTSFLDDAFIYLHVANNILDVGSAQFYPIADCPSLITSSPLRLILLLPAAALSRLVSDPDRSIAAARLTFLVYGVLASIIWLPFFWASKARWLAGAIAAGLIALSTETGLQMEGILIFWAVYTLLALAPLGRSGAPSAVDLGIASALFVLTRPEYGLVALALFVASYIQTRSFRRLARFVGPVLAGGALWVVLALSLHVYPIPTTYVTKVVTAENRVFAGGTFIQMLAERTEFMFMYQHDVSLAMFVLYAIAMVGLLVLADPAYMWVIAFIVLSLFVVAPSAGTYLWYTENFYVVVLTVCLAAAFMLWRRKEMRWRLGSIVVIVPIVLFLTNNYERNRNMTWNFKADNSRGLTYEAIGERYLGGGLFGFDRIDACYIALDEIGIVSYFGGPDVWVMDNSGLAQPATLEGVKDHALARLYPSLVWRTAEEGRDVIRKKFSHRPGDYPSFFVYANPGKNQVSTLCDYYEEETGICLRQLRDD